MKNLVLLVVVLCLGFLILGFTGEIWKQQAAAPQRYEVRELGMLGGTKTQANGMNDKGQIVGRAMVPSGDWHAFLWENGSLKDLNLGRTYSESLSINNNGVIVGYAADTFSGGNLDAFIWDNGTIIHLGDVGIPYDINELGQVVGEFGFWEDGEFTSLGSLAGDDAVGVAINKWSQVVGRADVNPNPNAQFHAFFWENGKLKDLGAFPGETNAGAYDINDKGQIVGGGQLGRWGRAAYWEGDQIKDMGTLGRYSSARAINNDGIVVGSSFTDDKLQHAFVWDPVNKMQNLDDFIDVPGRDWEMVAAQDINSSGQIICVAWVDTNNDGMLEAVRSVLLTPDIGATIDIQHHDDLNRVNPYSFGDVYVAILTGNGFDAANVDPSSVTFGREGHEASPRWYRYKNVDGDRDMDYQIKFKIKDTGIQCGDSSAYLQGKTLSGNAFQARDFIDTGICEVIQILEEARSNLFGLPLNVFRHDDDKKELKFRLNMAIRTVNREQYRYAQTKLENRILRKMDGCALRGTPDVKALNDTDWIKTCEAQARVYPLIREAADLLEDYY